MVAHQSGPADGGSRAFAGPPAPRRARLRSYIAEEHALLAMIRRRDTVPAHTMAGPADLDVSR